MDESRYLALLAQREIKPTAIRLLVLKAMDAVDYAVSLSDLEGLLQTVDKSSIFRAITLFHARRLVHSIDDGSGSVKYALCAEDCMCEIPDLHAHFSCEHCGRTFCIEQLPVPAVRLPEGFELHSVNFVMKGLCDKCRRKGAGAGTQS